MGLERFTALLPAKCHAEIDRGGTAGGKPAGRKRESDEQSHGDSKGERIAGLYFEQQRRKYTSGGHRARQTRDCAHRDHTRTPSHQPAHDAGRAPTPPPTAHQRGEGWRAGLTRRSQDASVAYDSHYLHGANTFLGAFDQLAQGISSAE